MKVRAFGLVWIMAALSAGCAATADETVVDESKTGIAEEELSAGGGVCSIAAAALPNPSLFTFTRIPSYAEQETFARQATADYLPVAIRAVGLSPRAVNVQTAPGGFSGIVFPSLQLTALLSQDACKRLAAAVGYVFEQDSVLTWRPGASGSYTGYVAFADGQVSPSRASAFFTHILSKDPRLAGGFSTRGPSLVFLNVRDPSSGAPFSSLTDVQYKSALSAAASSFGVRTFVVSSQSAEALVASPWQIFPRGEGYVFVLGSGVAAQLEPARLGFDAKAREAVNGG